MAISPLIALQGQFQSIDPVGAFQGAQQTEAVTEGQEISNRTKEQDQKLRDAAQLDFELETILKQPDQQVAVQNALERINSDTTMTPEEKAPVIQQIQSGDVQGVLRDIESSKSKFEQLGITKGVSPASAASGGGATGALIDKLKSSAKESGEPITDIQALSMIKGLAGQGLKFDEQGNVVAQSGVAEAKGSIKQAEGKGGKLGELQARLELEPSVSSAIEIAKLTGKEKGEAEAKLEALTAQFPRLQEVTNELSALGKKATFTLAGQAKDQAMRQLGLNVGEGAIARKEYISKVDNEVLPLLRQTFGAQFTEREGESLKRTLGDQDASPAEKDAVLRSFIAQKASQIETLEKQVGTEQPTPDLSGFKVVGFE